MVRPGSARTPALRYRAAASRIDDSDRAGDDRQPTLAGLAETGGRIALGAAGVVRTDVRVEPGREVTIGVRPEHLALGGKADAAISGTVEMIEQLGADTLVHVAADKAQVVARLPHGVSPEVGSTVALGADPSRVYIFDGTTGARIR